MATIEWVSVSDGMPPGEEVVLVVWLGQVILAVWHDYMNNWQEWPDGDFAIDGYVTAWALRPEPPNTK